MIGKLYLEIGLAKDQIEYPIPEKYIEVINEFLNYENDAKIFLNIPADWIGLKHGILKDMISYFRTALFCGIAYITPDFNEQVVDFDGRGDMQRGITRLEIVMDDRKVAKYVKKDLLIISCLNAEKGHYELKGYVTDTKSANPIVQVIDMYFVESETGMTVSSFIAGLSRDRVIQGRMSARAE